MFPVRCFTCGKVIGGKWVIYQTGIHQGQTPKQVLDQMGMVRFCCRRMFLTHIERNDS